MRRMFPSSSPPYRCLFLISRSFQWFQHNAAGQDIAISKVVVEGYLIVECLLTSMYCRWSTVWAHGWRTRALAVGR